MKFSFKSNNYSHLRNPIIISSSVCILYFLVSIFLIRTNIVPTPIYSSLPEDVSLPTSMEHLVFGIASSKKSWPKRKELVKLWWKPDQMIGCVFLDEKLDQQTNDTSLPPVCISGNTSLFRYTYQRGLPSAIRVARVVSETVALNHSGVRWYVFGDDDTIFFSENLAKTLSKYDHDLWYYIGTNSEMFTENKIFGMGMAFGGAGFAISSPLAKILAKNFDSCIERYSHLYGSDSRVYSCLTELGIGLTLEPGFHQVDLRGDIFGLLASHPVTPLVSLHHLELTYPIFPHMTTTKALQHLFKATNMDPQRILQQTICYHKLGWTILVSWGYAVQIFPNHHLLPDVLHTTETFSPWKYRGVYAFTTRQLHPDPCYRPTLFFLDDVSSGSEGIMTNYIKSYVNCTYDSMSPKNLNEVRVHSQKLDLDIKQLLAPRRHCCDVLPSSAGEVMEVAIRECKEEEFIHMHT